MTILIDLSADDVTRLTHKAAQEGQGVEAFVQRLAQREARSSHSSLKGELALPEDKATRFLRWAYAHDPATPPLSPQAVARESLYADVDTDVEGSA